MPIVETLEWDHLIATYPVVQFSGFTILGTAADYVAEADFAGGAVRLRDVDIGLTSLPAVRQVRVGYFREPFSLEGATSSRFITFLERSPLNPFDPTRNWGVAGYWWTEAERLTFAAGAYRNGTDGSGFSGGDEDAWAATARLTGLPVNEDAGDMFRLVHVGAAFSQRSPAGGVVRYDAEPQSSLLALPDNPVSPFLPEVNLPSTGQQLFNIQAAGVHGPASVQAEWFGTTIQQAGAPAVFLHGFYTSARYFVTGAHREYDRQRAAFDGVKVRRPLTRDGAGNPSGVGAIELTARFSFSNFDSANLSLVALPAGTRSGAVLYDATAGVNLVWDNAAWHVSGRVRRWIAARNRRVRRTKRGCRIRVCGLPVKAPWLNAIEPKWVHGKRAVVEPDRTLTADELEQRVCDDFGCRREPP